MSEDAQMPSEPKDEDDLLAAEYVLGVLGAEDRARAAARIEQDLAFARLVVDWESRLADMNTGFAEVTPPPAVKTAIDDRLFGEAPAAEKASLWSSLAFWRGISGMALAGLAALAIVVFTTPDERPAGETLVASLSSEDRSAQFVAIYDTAKETLSITATAGEKPSDRDFELWLIAGQKAPVSLGLVGAAGDRAPKLADALKTDFSEGVTLAVSLEPLGGSTTGAPTGPVIALGSVKKI